MKKTIYFMAVAATIAAISCTKEIEPSVAVCEGNTTLNFTTTTVKSELGADGVTVNWLSSDKISVFDSKSANCEFSALSVDGANASFTGNAESSDTYYALYPYSASASVSGSVISTTLPSEQTLKKDSFGDGLNIAVAKCTTLGGSTFQNVTSLLRFVIPAELDDIVKIEISSPETIAGDFTVDLAGETPAVTKGSGSKKITLTAEDGAKIPAGMYYASLLPGEISGLTVTVTTLGGETASFTKDAAVTLNRSKVRSIGTVKIPIYHADNLTAWNEGKTINIAGEKYSKSLNGEATVLKADAADTEISSLKPGVYILDAEDGCNFKVSHDDNGLNLSGDVILIGRYGAKRPLVKLVGYAKIGGKLAMRDIELDCSASTKNYKFMFSKLTEYFHVDACKVIAYNDNQTAYSMNLTKSIRIVNSDIAYNKAANGTVIGMNFSSTTHMYDLKELTVENNVFYNPNPIMYQIAGCNTSAKVESQVGTPGGFSISLCNNTFYNIISSSAAGALFTVLSADVVTIDGNLFYTNATAGAHRCVRQYDSSKPMPATLNAGTNIAYGLAFQSAWKYIYDTTEKTMKRITQSPFATVDESTLTFIPVETYSALGAQRN